MQLYEQIENEFDEKFVNTLYSTQSDVQVDVWKLIDYGNGEHKIGHYYGPDEVKSFLKQSFIKFLQAECERLESKIETIGLGEGDKIMRRIRTHRLLISEDIYTGYEIATSDTISHYQNMIKELHG